MLFFSYFFNSFNFFVEIFFNVVIFLFTFIYCFIWVRTWFQYFKVNKNTVFYNFFFFLILDTNSIFFQFDIIDIIYSTFFFLITFFQNIFNLSISSIWCSMLFDANWTTLLTLNYQIFIFQYPGFLNFKFEFFCSILKFLPYFVDIYLFFLIMVITIFTCIGKWVSFPEFRVFWSALNGIKIITLFYLQLFFFQYFLFCYDIKFGPIFFFINDDVQFGQLDSWVILSKFLVGLSVLLFFYILSDFVNFSAYLWSYEAIIFILIAFEMLYIAISTHNLLILLGAISGVSISTYILISLERTYSSLESAIKYFCLSALATGMMAFGYILLYHISTGTLFNFYIPNLFNKLYFKSYNFQNFFSFGLDNSLSLLGFTNFPTLFSDNLSVLNNYLQTSSYYFIYQCGFTFFLTGFFFKLSLFPCYIWAPDVYEGAPTLVVAFMIIVVKFVIFLVLMRVIFTFSNFDFFFWNLFKIIGCFSIVIGSVGALVQQKIKRFLAFTSINQMGLMLLGLSFDPLNTLGTLFALLVYVSTNLIFFGIILTTREAKSQRLVTYMSDLHNLFISSPKSIIYLTISILSMSGIPPFSGFFSKYFLILPVINSEYGIYWGFFVLFFHIVGSFNYLRLIRDMWFYDLSKLLFFYSCLSNKNFLLIQFLCFFQLFCIFGLDYILIFCNYWRWSLYTVNWC